MKNEFKVYRHRRLDNFEVFYIGIGKRNRCTANTGRNNWWKKIVQKAGRQVEILAENLSWEDACDLEKLLISEYGRKDLGLGTLCNLTDGGDGVVGRVVSEECKQKISNGNKGKKRTQEQKNKLKESFLGRVFSEATREKLRLKGFERVTTEETKLKLRKIHLGKKKKQESILKKQLTHVDLPKSNKITTSKYKGVSYVKSRNKWRASIIIDGKTKNLGDYLTEEFAHKVFIAANNERKELYLSRQF